MPTLKCEVLEPRISINDSKEIRREILCLEGLQSVIGHFTGILGVYGGIQMNGFEKSKLARLIVRFTLISLVLILFLSLIVIACTQYHIDKRFDDLKQIHKKVR